MCELKQKQIQSHERQQGTQSHIKAHKSHTIQNPQPSSYKNVMTQKILKRSKQRAQLAQDHIDAVQLINWNQQQTQRINLIKLTSHHDNQDSKMEKKLDTSSKITECRQGTS